MKRPRVPWLFACDSWSVGKIKVPGASSNRNKRKHREERLELVQEQDMLLFKMHASGLQATASIDSMPF